MSTAYVKVSSVTVIAICGVRVRKSAWVIVKYVLVNLMWALVKVSCAWDNLSWLMLM
jgi:hypothetical protein